MTKKQSYYFAKNDYFKITNEREVNPGIISITSEGYEITLSEGDYNELIKNMLSLYSNPIFLKLNVINLPYYKNIFEKCEEEVNYKNLQQLIICTFITYKILIDSAEKCSNYEARRELGNKFKNKFRKECSKIKNYIAIIREYYKDALSNAETSFLDIVLDSIKKKIKRF